MSDPINLALVRAERAVNSCADWRPRDAIVEMLREIDAGEINPYALVIAFAEKADDGGDQTGYRNACPNVITAQGIMSRVAWRLNDPEG